MISPLDIAKALRTVDPKVSDPTPEQIAIISAPLEPAVVIAGAGSGKTETMSARVLWLVANKIVEPEEILGLTFTRKADCEREHTKRTKISNFARERSRIIALYLWLFYNAIWIFASFF
mgnify:CR=1 FL=1